MAASNSRRYAQVGAGGAALGFSKPAAVFLVAVIALTSLILGFRRDLLIGSSGAGTP